MKRTKKQKVKANLARVNSQIAYKFTETYNSNSRIKVAENTDKYDNLASIKKELYKSLIVALFILCILAVVYWVS